jgi:hypothetical protein
LFVEEEQAGEMFKNLENGIEGGRNGEREIWE